MTITNNTHIDLYISGKVLNPNETCEFSESMFNTLNIHSDIGSCVITTEYGKRSFKYFGNLKAKEISQKNSDGMKDIIVYYSE
jgi:hypothetical protein